MSDPSKRYSALCRLVRSGNRPTSQTVRRVLTDAGRTADDFLDVTLGNGPDRALPGDPCPDCAGRLIVIDSRAVGDRRVRRIGCRTCGHRADRKLITTQ